MQFRATSHRIAKGTSGVDFAGAAESQRCRRIRGVQAQAPGRMASEVQAPLATGKWRVQARGGPAAEGDPGEH